MARRSETVKLNLPLNRKKEVERDTQINGVVEEVDEAVGAVEVVVVEEAVEVVKVVEKIKNQTLVRWVSHLPSLLINLGFPYF